jgi:hypothetical protein
MYFSYVMGSSCFLRRFASLPPGTALAGVKKLAGEGGEQAGFWRCSEAYYLRQTPLSCVD